MQEWMKEILGGAYTPELGEALAQALNERFASKEKLDAALAQAADWKKKAQDAETTAAAQIADMQFDARLNAAIAKAGGRSEKAIKALLDLDALRQSQNPEQDIAAALEQLKQENGYLFDDGITPPRYAAGTGAGAPGGEPDAALRRAFGLGHI